MKHKRLISLVRELTKLTVAVTWLLKVVVKLMGVALNYSLTKLYSCGQSSVAIQVRT